MVPRIERGNRATTWRVARRAAAGSASVHTGMGGGPVSLASSILVGVASPRDGADLPSVRAPPLPVAPWHIAQLVRNRAIPVAGSPLAGSTWSAAGIDGPGPREAT